MDVVTPPLRCRLFRLIQDSLPSLRQLRQNPLYLLLSEILVICLIYLHHRRCAAGTETLDGEQGEFAIGGGVAYLYAQLAADGSHLRLLILDNRRNRCDD